MSYSAAYITMQRLQSIKPTQLFNDTKKDVDLNIPQGLFFGFDKITTHQNMQPQQGSLQFEQGLTTNQIKGEQGLFTIQPQQGSLQPEQGVLPEQTQIEQGAFNIQAKIEQGQFIIPQQGSLQPEQGVLPEQTQAEQGVFNMQPQTEQGAFLPEQGQFQTQNQVPSEQYEQTIAPPEVQDVHEFIPTRGVTDLNNLNLFEAPQRQKTEINLPKMVLPQEYNFFTERKHVSMQPTVYNFDISTDDEEDEEAVDEKSKENRITDKRNDNTKKQPSVVTEERQPVKEFIKLSRHVQKQPFVIPTQNEEVQETADTEVIESAEKEIVQNNNTKHEFARITDELREKMTNFFTTGGHFEPDEVFIYADYLNTNREQTTRQAFEYKQQLRTDIPMQINQNEVRADFVAGRTTKVHSTTSKVTETDNQKGGNSGSDQRNHK